RSGAPLGFGLPPLPACSGSHARPRARRPRAHSGGAPAGARGRLLSQQPLRSRAHHAGGTVALARSRRVADRLSRPGGRGPVRSLVPGSAKKPPRAKKSVIRLVPKRPVAKSKRLGFTAAPRSNKPAVTRVALVPGTATREECLKRYLPLVRYVVERVASGLPHYVDHEDLHSAGVLGLLHAYDKFDAKKGNKFETYAVWRIKGAVLDQLRSLDL